MLTKFPIDIHKFKGKPGEYPGDHVTTFHLWCSSNSLKDDFIWLCLFQCTVIGGFTKLYIKIDSSKYGYFNNLAMVFLNHFQLLVRYDARTELLANFDQTKVDHILNHISKWRKRKSLIKFKVSPTFFLEWFLSSLVHCVSKYIVTSNFFSEEDAIMRA
jgi:hypothetical protein